MTVIITSAKPAVVNLVSIKHVHVVPELIYSMVLAALSAQLEMSNLYGAQSQGEA